MNDETVRKKRPQYATLVFGIISSIGVVCAIYFGYHSLPRHVEPLSRHVEHKGMSEFSSETVPQDNRMDIKDSEDFQLIQFELNGTESGFIKSESPFAAIGDEHYTTYYLSPYYNQPAGPVGSSNPVFSVVIRNDIDREIVISRILYRVDKIGGVKGGGYGPIAPNVKYRHGLRWRVGDQLAELSPPFGIDGGKAGSFLLELESIDDGIGLAWLLEIIFLNAKNEGVSTGKIQIIMSKQT